METKLKFKVGDRVRVKSLEWYDFNKDVNGDIYNKTELNVFVRDMAQYCGKVLNITKLNCDSYIVEGNIYSWLDWMLEDEPVTEEKQEVEQLNQNDLETKKMTLQEAQNFVKDTKYIVWNEDESRRLQEKLFEIGCEWYNRGKIICHTDCPFLFIDENLDIRYFNKNFYEPFAKSPKHYKQTDSIISIEIEQPKEEPKPKFDPNTLEVFDKVLVRDTTNKMWIAKFYHHKDKDGYHMTDNMYFDFCIPFNDDTKHLHRTFDEAPEFYKLD